jgi:hypothetical protein
VSIAVPSALPSAAGWQFSDWQEVQRSAPASAAGVATIELGQLSDAEMWLVDRSVAYCTSSTATTMRLYLNSVGATSFRDGTLSGNFDVAEYPRGLLVRPSSGLVAQWTGCAAGAVATLTLQVQVHRRVG